MRICLDMGHTLSGANTGAVGYMNESNETRRLGQKVAEYLQSMGHTVYLCKIDVAKTNADSLSQRVKFSNKQDIDLFVSLHFNAGKGTGCEVFTNNGAKFIQATNVLKKLELLGFKNRGVKDGSKFYVIKNTKARAMLVETCFVDTKEDVILYNARFDDVAKAIAEGICGGTVSTVNTKPTVDKSSELPKGVIPLPNTSTCYTEQTRDGRLLIHLDKENYLSLGKGEFKVYLSGGKVLKF